MSNELKALIKETERHRQEAQGKRDVQGNRATRYYERVLEALEQAHTREQNVRRLKTDVQDVYRDPKLTPQMQDRKTCHAVDRFLRTEQRYTPEAHQEPAETWFSGGRW